MHENEWLRYSRQIPVIGLAGQEKLAKSHVLCVGLGGLGSPAALYLAAAGIGQLTLVDADRVEVSNLQRQILFTENDIGLNKAICAAQHLRARNLHLQINAVPAFLTDENAVSLMSQCDVIVDGTDNYTARHLINRHAKKLNKPWVFASLLKFKAQMSVFNYEDGPCYHCLYPETPAPDVIPTCASAGVLGVLPGIIGSLQALEVMKILLKKGEVLSGTVLTLEALTLSFKRYTLRKNPLCCVELRV